MKKRERTTLVNIGRIGSSSGLRGEVRVNLYAKDSDNLKEGKVLLLKRAGREISAELRSVRWQKDRPVIRLAGIDDRNAADELNGMEVYIHEDELEELPEGEHYVRDLIGYRVVDLAGAGDIGSLRDVIQNTSQSILEVETPDGRSVLIPAVDAFLKNIDDENGIIEVSLIPGLM